MFNFPKEITKIIKQDSTTIDDVKVFFSGNLVLVEDGNLLIEEGDIIERTLPNTLKEQYLIIDRGYFSGTGTIPAHYQMKVEKQHQYKKASYGSVVNHYVFSEVGKVNIQSTDNSVNTSSYNSNELFDNLRALANQLPNHDVANEKISEMEAHVGKPSFSDKYNAFIQSVANHMTIFAPFIPMLTELLPK